MAYIIMGKFAFWNTAQISFTSTMLWKSNPSEYSNCIYFQFILITSNVKVD